MSRKNPLPQKDSGVDLVQNFFDGKQSLVIGENHSDIAPKKFLVENMQALKDRGYDVLFLEHLPMKDIQLYIDLIDYKKKPSKPFGEKLKLGEKLEEKLGKLQAYLKGLDDGHLDLDRDERYIELKYSYNFTKIVEEAIKAGMRVVCLEESLELYKRVPEGRNRIISFNAYAQEIINNELVNFKRVSGIDNPKWIAFVGVGHVHQRFNVAGLAEMFPDVKSLIITDNIPQKVEKTVDEKEADSADEKEAGPAENEVIVYDKAEYEFSSTVRPVYNEKLRDNMYASNLLSLAYDVDVSLGTIDEEYNRYLQKQAKEKAQQNSDGSDMDLEGDDFPFGEVDFAPPSVLSKNKEAGNASPASLNQDLESDKDLKQQLMFPTISDAKALLINYPPSVKKNKKGKEKKEDSSTESTPPKKMGAVKRFFHSPSSRDNSKSSDKSNASNDDDAAPARPPKKRLKRFFNFRSSRNDKSDDSVKNISDGMSSLSMSGGEDKKSPPVQASTPVGSDGKLSPIQSSGRSPVSSIEAGSSGSAGNVSPYLESPPERSKSVSPTGAKAVSPEVNINEKS